MNKRAGIGGLGAVVVLALGGCMGASPEPEAPEDSVADTSSSATANPSSSPSPTSTASATPSPEPVITTNVQFLDPEKVDRSSAEGVARAAVQMIATWDPAHDKTETAGAVRAKPLFTDELAQRTVEPERPATGSSWRQAAEAGAWSAPTLTKKPNTHGHYSSAGPDTHEHEGEEFTFTVNWVWVVSATGERVPDPERREYRVLSVEEQPGVWSVADWTYDLVEEAPEVELNL